MEKLNRAEWIGWTIIFFYFIIMTTSTWFLILTGLFGIHVYVSFVISIISSVFHCIAIAFIFSKRFDVQEIIGTPVTLCTSAGFLLIAVGLFVL